MKMQIVIRVQMNCDKCRRKAMMVVASAGGVDSVKLDGKEKDQLVVTGEGVDPVCLVRVLRKKVGHSDLVGVEELKAKPKEPKVEPNVQWHYCAPAPPLLLCDDPCYSSSSGCSIM